MWLIAVYIDISRCNFPLSLGWAVTIHKVQGMTIDEIVLDMTEQKGKYKVGQAYVDEIDCSNCI